MSRSTRLPQDEKFTAIIRDVCWEDICGAKTMDNLKIEAGYDTFFSGYAFLRAKFFMQETREE